jgi:hypothetical protein
MRTFTMLAVLTACAPDADAPTSQDVEAETVAHISGDAPETDFGTAWLDSLTEAEHAQVGELLLSLPDRAAALDVDDHAGRLGLFDELRQFGDPNLVLEAIPYAGPDRDRATANCSAGYSYARTASDKLDLSEINSFRAEFSKPTSNAWWTVWAAMNGASAANSMAYYASVSVYNPSYKWTAISYSNTAVQRSMEAWSWALYEQNYWYGHSISYNWSAVRITSWDAYIASLNAQAQLGAC